MLKLCDQFAEQFDFKFNTTKSVAERIGRPRMLMFDLCASANIFRLDALALSVTATATWLAGWLAGWLGVRHSRYCIKTTKPIRKLFAPSGSPII